jgi:hypothetical protein
VLVAQVSEFVPALALAQVPALALAPVSELALVLVLVLVLVLAQGRHSYFHPPRRPRNHHSPPRHCTHQNSHTSYTPVAAVVVEAVEAVAD